MQCLHIKVCGLCMCTYILTKEILSIRLTFSLFPQTPSTGCTELYSFSKLQLSIVSVSMTITVNLSYLLPNIFSW